MIIGIAGTAKNTGKTTTLSAITQEAKKETGLTLALSSIGYDGEAFDNVTGLPKPRINVWPGNIVAIAERCNRFCSAELETIKQTDIRTPMGKVVISRVCRPGKVVLAGPNNRRELRVVIDMLSDLAGLIIIDGALNRIAPMVEVDRLILVTGAARYTEIPRLALESRCIVEILSTRALKESGKAETASSILNRAGFEGLLEKCSLVDSVRINGVIAEQYLKELSALPSQLANKRLIFDDPIKLLLAGDPSQVWDNLQKISSGSTDIGVEKTCELLAMTVNPYYPKYRYNRADYQAAYVDSVELLESVSGSVKIPCYDIVRQGGQNIFQMIMDLFRVF